MSTRPYSIRRARLVPDLNDPNLYGAWGMVPQGGLLVDHTARGNDGTPGVASVVEQTILGPMRRYLPNSGVASSTMGAANAFALTDLTISYWFRLDLTASANSWSSNYYLNVSDAWGIYHNGGTDIRIYDDIDNAGALRYPTTVPRGKLVRVDAVMNALQNLLYVEGVLVGSGASSSAAWSSFAGTLYHGSRALTASPFEGIVGPLLVYNAAKDQSWVTAEYLKGARACQLKTDWGVKISTGNEGSVGAYVGVNSSPFEIISGAWKMSMDTIEGQPVKVLECVQDGIIAVPCSLFEATPTECAYGTWDWWGYKPDAGALIVGFISTDQAVATSGYNVNWAADESVVIEEAGVGNVVAGGTASAATWHRFRQTRRYDGLFTGYVDRTAYGTGTDTTVTTSLYVPISATTGCKVAYSDRRGDHCFAKYLGVVTP